MNYTVDGLPVWEVNVISISHPAGFPKRQMVIGVENKRLESEMTEQTGGDTVAVDFSRIQETSGGDTEFEHELFQLFLDDSTERIATLKTALAEGDVTRVHLEAHTLKGAGVNVGTSKFHEIAADLEQLDGDALGSLGQSLLTDLEAEHARVRSEITSYIGGL